MRHTQVFGAIAFITTLSWTVTVRAEEPRVAIPPELILERFKVAKGGDALIVPVSIDGKEHPFLVDTGAQITVFNIPLLKGSPKRVTTLNTLQGTRRETKEYDPPRTWIGKIPFPTDGTILSMDFQGIREALELPVEGILGMDFLGRHVVHLDFDRGEILILNSAPERESEVIPLYLSQESQPAVAGSLTGSDGFYFLVDTGWVGKSSMGLMKDEAKKGLAAGKLMKIGDSRLEIATGKHISPLYQGIFLEVGGFSIEDPLIHETVDVNLIGLRFWSRFVVTFDFPGRRVLLSKGQNFKRKDEWNRSGIWLLPRNDAVRIEHVSSESVGLAAGAKVGDTLLEVGGLKATPKNLTEVRARLRKPGPIECVVRREGKEHRLTLVVPE